MEEKEKNETPEKDQKEIELEIISALDKIRPFIERDGGDIRFDHYDCGTVYVRFFGACLGCASMDYTLQEGVAAILKDAVPEVEEVVNVDALFDEEMIESNIEEN